MSEHRFHLEKYRPGNRYECPNCGRKRCFSRYVDEQGEITFPERVGRCNHESSCGYHYSPKDFFRDNPDKRPMRETRGQFLPSAPPVPPVPHATTSKRQGAGSSFNKVVTCGTVPPLQAVYSCDDTPSFIDNSIVESEKTALIASHFIKDPLWIATGGMHGCLNEQVVSVLKGRRVTLFPDLGAEDVWRKKLSLFTFVCQSVAVSDILQRNATEEQRRKGLDLADFLLMEESKQAILEKMIALNPALQLLIDKLDLVRWRMKRNESC